MINSLYDIPAIHDYLKRIGAEPRSLRSAVVKESHGAYWKDIAIITFTPDGKVKCAPEYEPTQSEAAAIIIGCLSAQWPTIKRLKKLINLPKEIEEASSEDVFEFRDLDGDVIMLQLRREKKGEKAYIPYTYWSDGKWRCMEPEGTLPLWGLEQLKDHSTVFIHEGAKAARAVREMVEGKTPAARAALDAHPWGEELKSAAHVGWIGGALSPYRTQWKDLMEAGIKRAYIVSDNDAPGVAAVPSIAFHLMIPTFHVQFTNEWPMSFDLADHFPKSMFKEMEGKQYYTGPSFRACLHPATWATDQIPNKQGKPTVVLRQNFKEMWAYVEEADLFVCVDMPEIVRAEPIMNKMLAPFSHSNQTGTLIVKAYTGRSVKLCYRPDAKGKVVTDYTTSAINLHTPTHIKSKSGNTKPFMEFMDYMFPVPRERHEVLRWCATLIARLDVHMMYGMLLVSERQGVGKTTLGAAILAPLVGIQNASFPSETQITSGEFNGWMANKRLAVVNEIYSGHSWKAYHKLKTSISDNDITVNEKFQRPYRIDNWVHFFACSNSMKALKIEDDDRRWFMPDVTEEKWPRDKFERFYSWLKSGGLAIIKHWAENFGDYVLPGAPAPSTIRKREVIHASRSDGQQEAVDLAENANRLKEPIVMTMKEIVGWVRHSVQGHVYDTDLEIRKAMKEAGTYWFEERVVVGGRLQMVMMNEFAWSIAKEKYPLQLKKKGVQIICDFEGENQDEIIQKTNDIRLDFVSWIRTLVKSPSDIVPPAM